MPQPNVVSRFCQAALVCALSLLPGSAVWAQMLDRVEVNRVGAQAEIRIGFATQVQLLRFAPPQGKLLRIFVRLINPQVPENELMQETVSSPGTDLVPRFSVTYPELNNGMLLTFSQATTWDVKPGTDGRSIVVVVPLLPGAKDVIAEVRATPESPAAPIAAAQPPAATPAPAVAATPEPAVETPKKKASEAEAAVVKGKGAKKAKTKAPPAVPPPVPVAEAQQRPLIAQSEPAPAPAPAVKAELPAAPVSPQPAEPAASVDAAPTVPALTAEQVEDMARKFFDEARQALAEKDLQRALNRLNRTLGLPTNSQTEPAQALIGEAREINGEFAKARAEYELYLKLFPKGAAADRIRDRLAKLPAAGTRQASRPPVPRQAGPAEWTFFGSVAQNFYKGKSHIEVTTPPPPGQLNFTTDNLSMTDQHALISTLDINARRRDGVTDTRIVIRDTNTQNYLSRQKSVNRLYSAYIEQSDRNIGYTVRAGRQNPTGGGVLERFDGIQAGYNLDGRWRINGVAGIPVEFNSPYKKDFYGFSVDLQAQPDMPGVSAYFVEQHMEGVVNRQAVGLESRYFNPQATVYGMVDYDIAYKGLNIAMAQANYRSEAGTNYFAYLDHRKTPPYSLTNALPGMPGLSIKDGLNTFGLNQLREEAKALTATSDMVAVGLTHPYSPRWLLGADYRAAEISGTQATGTMPALPGSGLNHVFSVQAIGNNLWAKNDVGVVNGSLIIGPNYDGQALGGNYVFLYKDDWRLDGNLRYYGQKNDEGERQVRLSPSFKVSYRWKLVTLEAEVGSEQVKIDGPNRNERSNRTYFYVGYRADMR